MKHTLQMTKTLWKTVRTYHSTLQSHTLKVIKGIWNKGTTVPLGMSFGEGIFFSISSVLWIVFLGGKILFNFSSGCYILLKKDWHKSILLSSSVGWFVLWRKYSYDTEGHIISHALLWMSSILSDSSCVSPGCRTGIHNI